MTTKTFAIFTFSAASLLTSSEMEGNEGSENLFDALCGKSVSEMRAMAGWHASLGLRQNAAIIRLAADRLAAGLVPTWVQTKALNESIEIRAWLAVGGRDGVAVAHWSKKLEEAERVLSAPAFF